MTMIWSCIRTALVSGFVTLAAAVSLSACSSGSISGEVDGGPTSDGGSSGSDAAGGSGAVGFLHTQGNKIVDSRGVQVRLTGVSWFGMETDTFSPHGLDRRSLGSMLDQIKSLGYNSIRIPFSTQMLDAGSQAKGIDFAQNPSLQNKKPIEILDEVIRQAGARRLRIILDRHRPDAYSQANLWYTGAYSERRWIDDWKLLAARYKSDSTVVGFDLHNEPHGEATWGSGNQANDWRLAAERAGNEILAVHPDLLMIVEGIEQVGGKYYWWGGNLMAVGQNLVRLKRRGPCGLFGS
jgi:endoglucanase